MSKVSKSVKKEESSIAEKKPKKTNEKEKVYQLIGSFNFIQEKETKRKGKHYGKKWFKINVQGKIENMLGEEIKDIYAFSDVVKREQIWQSLVKNEWVDKRYLLLCYRPDRKLKLYQLFDWEEISKK